MERRRSGRGWGLPDEGKEGEETKPGMDMVSSKLEELERETAMKAHKKGEEEKKVDFVGEKGFK